MTSEEIRINRNIFISELQAAGRAGLESLVEVLDSSGFFSSRLDDTDPGDGSLVNRLLWELALARDLNSFHLESGRADAPEDESLVVASLLSGVRPAVKKSGFKAEESELAPEGLLAEILDGAARNARDYASGIPFCAVPVDTQAPQASYSAAEPFLDEEDHRLWWNVSQEGESMLHPDFDTYASTPSTALFSLPAGTDDSARDCSVLCDENGAMAFLSLFSAEDDGSLLMQSDRQCFNFADFTFYWSRYPQYRPSFVAAKRLDGKWGVFSVRKSGKKRLPLVEVTPMVRFEFRNRDAAVRAIKTRTGFPMRVSHHLFYSHFAAADCFNQ